MNSLFRRWGVRSHRRVACGHTLKTFHRGRAKSAVSILSDEQRKSFIRDGYVVLPGAVPLDVVERAVSFTDQAYADGRFRMIGNKRRGSAFPIPVFHHDVKTSPLITDLVYKSGLHKAADELLGEGNAIIRDQLGQIAYSEPNELFVQQGMSMHEPYPADLWHVDSGAGKYACLATDFACLIGVVLSEGQNIDENRGQFTAWPVFAATGSHYITHPALSEIILSNPSERVMEKFRASASSLDCGSPKRILVTAGDAFIVHQRLAHVAGVNLSDTIRRNVYFRVKHARLEDFAYKHICSPAPWTGFTGLQDLLPPGSATFDGRSPKDDQMNMRSIIGARAVAHSLPKERRERLVLSNDQKEEFMRDGFLVLRDFVPADQVRTANQFVTKAYANGSFRAGDIQQRGSTAPQLAFVDTVERAPQVTDLFLKSGLVDISEELLGKSNVMVRRNRGEVSFGCTSDVYMKNGMSLHAPFPREEWKIDPALDKYEAFGADYMLLVGITLSEGQDVDENRGQFVVWPGSHRLTHNALCEIIGQGTSLSDLFTGRLANNVDCGEPIRLLLRPGDVFLAHQRLAHASGVNLSPDIAKSVKIELNISRRKKENNSLRASPLGKSNQQKTRFDNLVRLTRLHQSSK